jgi:hypothetical protein
MITIPQFDHALKVVLDYIKQLENETNSHSLFNDYLDIQNDVTHNTFCVLKGYYKEVYNIDLEWSDLKKMSIYKLRDLDFDKLRMYRGFGVKSEFKLRRILEHYEIYYEDYKL